MNQDKPDRHSAKLASFINGEVPVPKTDYFSEIDATLSEIEHERREQERPKNKTASTDVGSKPLSLHAAGRGGPMESNINDTPGWDPSKDKPDLPRGQRRWPVVVAWAAALALVVGGGAFVAQLGGEDGIKVADEPAVTVTTESPEKNNNESDDGVVNDNNQDPVDDSSDSNGDDGVGDLSESGGDNSGEEPVDDTFNSGFDDAAGEEPVDNSSNSNGGDSVEDSADGTSDAGGDDVSSPQSYAGPADEFRPVCDVEIPDNVALVTPSAPVPPGSGGDDFWWVLSGTNSTGGTIGVVVVEPGAAHLDDAGVVFAKSGAIVSSIGKSGLAGRALFYEPGAIISIQQSLRGPLIECGEIVTSVPTPTGGIDASQRPVDVTFAEDDDVYRPIIGLDNEEALSSFVFGADTICLDRYRLRFKGLHDSSPVEVSVVFADGDGSVLATRLVNVSDVGTDISRSHSISYSSSYEGGFGGVTDAARDLCVGIEEAGTYSITIEIDPSNLIEEVDETNNRYTRAFEVSGF